MKDILTKLSSKYGCDKSDKNHLYTKIYNNIFENYRNEKFNMIELSVCYFSNAIIYFFKFVSKSNNS